MHRRSNRVVTWSTLIGTIEHAAFGYPPSDKVLSISAMAFWTITPTQQVHHVHGKLPRPAGLDTRPTPTRRCPDHHHQPSQSNSTSSQALRVSAPPSQRRFQRRSRCRQRLHRGDRRLGQWRLPQQPGQRQRSRQCRVRQPGQARRHASGAASPPHDGQQQWPQRCPQAGGYNPASNGSRRADHSQGSAAGARLSSAQGSHCPAAGGALACCWSRHISQSARNSNSAVAKLPASARASRRRTGCRAGRP